jgi:hypothetical protein
VPHRADLDNKGGRYVETVWPSISELRTTAFRTGKYAGRDPTSFGPDLTSEFPTDNETVKVVHPEWAQITVYRLVEGARQPFPGPTVYWSESYASKKGGAPNEMWRKRPRVNSKRSLRLPRCGPRFGGTRRRAVRG